MSMHTVSVIVLVGLFLIFVYGFIRYLLIPSVRGSYDNDSDEDDGFSMIGASVGTFSMIGASVGTAVGDLVATELVEEFEHHPEPVATDEVLSDDSDTVSDD